MSKMGLHDSFGHLKHKLWPKERSRVKVKLAVWLLTTKSQESTRLPYVQVVCHIPLESPQQGLQLCFRSYLNKRFAHKVMVPQSRKSPNFGNFATLIWKSRDKMSFGCGPRGEAQNILWGGRWWLPPSPGCGESCESEFARGLS